MINPGAQEENRRDCPLTPRQLEVLDHLARGYMHKEACRILGIERHTVKNHVTQILDKLGTRNIAAAAAVAVGSGWIDISDVLRDGER